MKKKITLLIFGLLLATCLSSCANDKTSKINDSTKYRFDEKAEDYYTEGLIFDENIVTNYLGTDDVVYIPKTHDGFAITEIASGVFTDTMVKAVHMFDSITTIDEAAFKNATKLENIEFSDNIEYVGYEAFLGVPWYENQEKEVYIGKVLVGFGKKLEEESYTVDSSAIYVSPYAFVDQENLKEVNLNNVQKIGFSCFRNCPNIENIIVGNDFVSAGPGALVDTKWYYNKNSGPYYLGSTFCGYKGDMMPQETVEIVDGTISISEKALYSATDMAGIVLPESIKYIEDSAFEGCTLLSNLVLPSSLNMIGKRAFYGCEKVNTIEIPGTVKVIEKESFANTAITSATLNEGLEVIKDYAFKGSIIKKIDFPKSLLSIGNYAFEECKKLKSISFKDDSLITSIGVGAFSNCLALQSFTIGKNFKVEEIKDYTFRKDLKLHDIDLSETVIKEYGKGVFYGCEALESFKFNNQVKKISSNLFSDCSSLSSVDFNDAQIEIVGEMAFSGCTSLSLISLPESVTEIEKYAFLESGLTSFNVGKNVNSIGIEAFSYTKIVEFTVDLNNNSYKAVDGVLFTKDSKELTAYPCASNLLEYVIPEDTEIIYAGAFMGASNIKKVTIGAKVNDIGDYAFASMASLTQIIVLNDTPAKLGSKTFNENDASIFVPQGSLDNYQKNWKSYKAKIKENS